MGLLFEDVLVFIMLVLSTGAFVTMGFGTNDIDQANAGLAWMQAVWIVLYSLTLWRLVARPSDLLRLLRWQPLITMLALLAIVSTAWSIDPGMTLRRSMAVLLTTVFALYFASRYTSMQQLRMLSRAMAVVVLASLFVGLYLPSIGIESGGILGAWRGVFGFKNDMGRLMALSAVASITLVIEDARGRLFNLSIAFLSVVLLVLSRSTTAILVFAAVFMVLLFDRFVLTKLTGRQFAAAAVMVPLLAGAVVLLVLEGSGAFLNLLGKDRTLTGRTVLWGVVLMNIRHHPWLGYGYNAFWTALQGAAVRNEVNWDAFQAHDGFLQLALDEGLLGVGLFLCSCIPVLFRLLRPSWNMEDGQSRWPFLFVVFYLLSNLTESSILTRNSIHWIAYAGVVAFASRARNSWVLEQSNSGPAQTEDAMPNGVTIQ